MGDSIIKMEKDHIIILSGASGGIGSELLKHYSKKNKIIALYNKNKPKIMNRNIEYLKINFLKKIKIKKMNFKNKKIIFVNLASKKTDKLLINYNFEDWKNTLQINVSSVFLILKILIPEMIKNRWGRIINFSSTDGLKGDIGTIAYSSSKHALHGINKVVSKEYAKFGITSNILILGNFNYGMFKKLNNSKQAQLLKKVPTGKTGNINNIINALDFITKSDYLNGSEINIDGGI